jgi:hypothetical protein
MKLPTLVIGPRAEGRGYQILARSGLTPLSSGALDMLESVPLALAGWADAGESDFAACIPLGQEGTPVLLMQARFMGAAAGGSVAFAHAVLVEERLPPLALWRILADIPAPVADGGFAAGPLEITPRADVPHPDHDWRGFGLAWQDRRLIVPEGEDRFAWLGSALLSITPPEQSRRIRGWATTAALVPTGSFVPAQCFNLIANANEVSPQPLPHLPARLTQRGFEGEHVAPPVGWSVWRDAAAFAGRLGLSIMPWQPALAAAKAARIATLALSAMVEEHPPAARIDILAHAARLDDAVLSGAARELFERSLAQSAIDDAAAAAAAWWALPQADRACLGRMEQVLLLRKDAAELPPAILSEALVAEPRAAAPILGALAPERRLSVAAHLFEADDWGASDAGVAALLVDLLAESAGDPEVAEFLGVGIGRLLDWASLPMVRPYLLTERVARALRAMNSVIIPRYAEVMLDLRRAVAEADPAQFAIALAALILVRERREALV